MLDHKLTARNITLMYGGFGVAWILISDRLVLEIASNPVVRSELQTAKGWVFVVSSAFLIYVLVGRSREALKQSRAELKETERRKREIQQYKEELERSNERLQEFAYVASHDLKQPLRMVSSYLDLLAEEYKDDLDEEAQKHIEFAVNGATRMRAMIDALLEYSRVHTEAEEFTCVDGNMVLEDTFQDLELLIEEHNATVTYDPLPVVKADSNQLSQVFQNLIRNAIEYAGDADPRIHVSATEHDGAYVFTVEDSGVGVPQNQQVRIFDIFSRGTNSRSDDSGTGIGLAICKRILERHNGEIWVDSDEGNGSTFYFTIPKVNTQNQIDEI